VRRKHLKCSIKNLHNVSWDFEVMLAKAKDRNSHAYLKH